MAWIKMQNSVGTILDLPEPVFNNFFKGKDGFTLVQESKPSSIVEKKQTIKKEGDNDGIQEPKLNENNTSRKSSKKASE